MVTRARGKAIIVRIARMAVATISSMSVKPDEPAAMGRRFEFETNFISNTGTGTMPPAAMGGRTASSHPFAAGRVQQAGLYRRHSSFLNKIRVHLLHGNGGLGAVYRDCLQPGIARAAARD